MDNVIVRIDKVFETPLTDEEKSKQEAENNKNYILTKIQELEAQQLRPLRELEVARILGETNDFAKEKVISINLQIAELRKQLP